MSNRARKLLIDATDYLWIVLMFSAAASAALEGSYQSAAAGAAVGMALTVVTIAERVRQTSKVYQWSRGRALLRAAVLIAIGASALFYWNEDQFLGAMAIAVGALHLPLVWTPKGVPLWRPVRL